MSTKELEVGMYVRLKGYDVNFGKLDSQVEDSHLWTVEMQDGYYDLNPLHDFKKASHNIIDLIEVGDYVNGILVSDITGEYLRIDGENHNKYYFSKEIKSILTHEQFEREAYKV